jgi:transposase-like protein
MLSDKLKNQYLPTRKRRPEGQLGYKRRYSDSQKIEAVTTYLMLGSLTMTASMLKININTLKLWRKSEWWKDVERDLRTQEDLQLSKRLQKIVTRSLDVIEDRMEHGDFVYDQKSGQMRRKPVNMRDAAKVMMDFQERQETLIDRHINNESISTDKVEQTLDKLAKEFERIANSIPTKNVEVTDVLFGVEENHAKDET